MGTGTNVQKRLVALHHLDAPWKPAEVEQREGRILRQGNDNEEVAIYRYVTEGSFDAYMWQALETKARFIAQVMTGDSAGPPGRGHRRPGAVLRRGEGHRLGQPGGADAGRGRRRVAAAGHPARRTTPTSSTWPAAAFRDLPETIARLTQRAGRPRRPTWRRWPPIARDPLTIGGRACRRDDALAALGHRLDALPEKVRETGRVPARPLSRPGLRPGAASRRRRRGLPRRGRRPATACCPATIAARGRCSTPSTGWPAATTASATPPRQELAIAEGQLRDYQARLGRPFAHEAYLSELTDLRDRLKAGLSQATPRAGQRSRCRSPSWPSGSRR